MIPNVMLTGDQLIRMSDERRRHLAAQWGRRRRDIRPDGAGLRPADAPVEQLYTPAVQQPVPVEQPPVLVDGRC